MKSQFAIDDIEELEASGLHPTPSDIIRLNALGLMLQAAKNKHAATSLDYLPRVAQMNDRIYLRQPTVGHEIWFARVADLIDKSFETVTAVRAFALSRNACDLPDPCSRESVKTAVTAFADEFSDLTRDQVCAALDYVIFGASPISGERCARKMERDEEREPDGTEGEDWKDCISLGVLNEGRIVLWGMTQRELESMTRRQLEDAIRRAYVFHNVSTRDSADDETADYYRTLDEIRERLIKEKEHGKQ